MEQRIALITGASRGIGRAVALELAKSGVHIIALARTQSALETLDDEIKALGGEATLVPCSLTDFPALDRLGLAIHQRWGKLDIFVANGAILGPISPLAHVEPKDFETVLATNVTANFRLLRSLDLPLRQSSAGRVVMMSSAAGNRAEFNPFWGPYAASKAALDALMRTYAAETKTTNVRVMAVDPGRMRTRMRAAAMPGEDPSTLRPPQDIAPLIAKLCAPEWQETGKIYNFPKDKIQSFQGPL